MMNGYSLDIATFNSFDENFIGWLCANYITSPLNISGISLCYFANCSVNGFKLYLWMAAKDSSHPSPFFFSWKSSKEGQTAK